MAVQNFATFDSVVNKKAAVNACVGMIHTTLVVLFISIVGFRVAQSYDRGQCEGLEPWERVTDSHVFFALGVASL